MFIFQSESTNYTTPEIFVLKNVTYDDAGWYTCLVGNYLGYNYRSAYLTVIPRKSQWPRQSSTNQIH